MTITQQWRLCICCATKHFIILENTVLPIILVRFATGRSVYWTIHYFSKQITYITLKQYSEYIIHYSFLPVEVSYSEITLFYLSLSNKIGVMQCFTSDVLYWVVFVLECRENDVIVEFEKLIHNVNKLKYVQFANILFCLCTVEM